MEERRRLIQKEVEEKGEVRVAYLSEKYNCSEVTIRNDIKALDQEGILKRVHGGAIALEKVRTRKYVAESIYKNTEQKRKIAACAYKFIEDRTLSSLMMHPAVSIWLCILRNIPKKDLQLLQTRFFQAMNWLALTM